MDSSITPLPNQSSPWNRYSCTIYSHHLCLQYTLESIPNKFLTTVRIQCPTCDYSHSADKTRSYKPENLCTRSVEQVCIIHGFNV